MKNIDLLIYGAYGYTGELISRLAVEKGLKPVLAGRDAKQTEKLANELGLPFLVFDLSEKDKVDDAIKNAKVVLHCAGPYNVTLQPVLDACLKYGSHYLDINGDLDVFERVAERHEDAVKAEVVLLPGVGFDVVPTDCLANFLKSELPNADTLELAFSGGSDVSRGTALTMAEKFHEGGAIRKDGKITKVPTAFEGKEIDYGQGPRFSMTIPWGDVCTAYYSTKIPNIKVFTAIAPKTFRTLKLARNFSFLVGLSPIQGLIKSKIRSSVKGPTFEDREKKRSLLWGEVSAADGSKVSAKMETPEGYKLTSMTALEAAIRVLKGQVEPGFKTPAMAFGHDFILDFEGVRRDLI